MRKYHKKLDFGTFGRCSTVKIVGNGNILKTDSTRKEKNIERNRVISFILKENFTENRDPKTLAMRKKIVMLHET